MQSSFIGIGTWTKRLIRTPAINMIENASRVRRRFNINFGLLISCEWLLVSRAVDGT